MTQQMRTFEDKPATRESVPLLIGLYGASGSGKTYSALRLAAGIQRVSGGEVFVIDTEARRSLHYADKFRFRHLQFDAPFGPLDYLAAVQHCVERGAKVIVIDSLSHEHESVGGVLEMHEAEQHRLAKAWGVSIDKTNLAAWAKPKAERRRFINTLLQLQCNTLLCFRAKEKVKPGEKGETKLQDLGWMPIAGEEYIYECTMTALLEPGSNGEPTWLPERKGEKGMVKLPSQFRPLFTNPVPLSEDLGEAMAKWAAGTLEGQAAEKFAQLAEAIELAPNLGALETLIPQIEQLKTKKLVPPAQYNMIRGAFKARKEALASAPSNPDGEPVADSKPTHAAPEERERIPGED